MDIHLPKVPHSWIELAKEIGIIVVGVLIALTAEQIVDHAQWRHKIRAAEATMREELLWDDGPQVYQRAAMHPCLVQRLNAIRAAVEGSSPRSAVSTLIDSYWVRNYSYDSVAHQEAIASDIASHMPADELKEFDNIYSQIPAIDRVADHETYDVGQLRALSHSGGPLSASEKERVLSSVETIRADEKEIWGSVKWIVPSLRALGSIDPVRIRIMMTDAREHYGSCVNTLPSDFPANLPPEDRPSVAFPQHRDGQ